MMNSFGFGHPSHETLVRYAEGETVPTFVRRHLERCAECRGVVQRAREVAELAPNLGAPAMDAASTWQRIQARRATGDRVLLPTVSEQPARVGSRGPWAVAAAVLLAVTITWAALRPMQSLEAGVQRGELLVDSAAVIPGGSVTLRYTAASALADEDSVVAVARFFGERGASAGEPVRAVLRRMDGTGRTGSWFSGDLALPMGALVTRFTVMSIDGRRVDDNDGRAWEFAGRDETGRPLFEALFTQYRLHMMEDWERGHRAVAEMVHHHPDRPMGWRFHINASRELAGPAGRDSVLAEYQPQIDRLHALYRDRPADDGHLWEMAMLATGMRDSSKIAFWRERLQREYPRSTAATQFRVFDITARHSEPRHRLAAMEELFAEVGGGTLQLAADAFDAAVATDDPKLIELWGERLSTNHPMFEPRVDAEQLKVPVLRANALARMRARVAQHQVVTSTDWISAADRGPARTTPERQAQSGLLQIGDALTADGLTAAAYDTLQRAASLGRNPAVLRRLAEVALAAGDTAAAARAWAWVVADPRTSAVTLDSARSRLGSRMESEEFGSWRASALQRLGQEVLASAFRQPIRTDVRLRDVRGRTVRLTDLQGSKATVVAFISRRCAPSLQDLESLQATAARLNAQGIPVIVVITEEPTATVREALSARGWNGQLHFDPNGEAVRAFRQAGTPAYFMVDDDNTVRFLARRASELMLQAHALSQ